MIHRSEDLIALFDACFYKTHQTRLIKGTDEPLYKPSQDSGQTYHAIIFAHGFFSSALHECAHWFIAGPARRLLEDYGYWYEPDGRTAQQQQLFQQVEIKPQALEWVLSLACGYSFHFSFDNVMGEMGDTQAFEAAVKAQMLDYLTNGLPVRAQRFAQALCRHYGTKLPNPLIDSLICL